MLTHGSIATYMRVISASSKPALLGRGILK